MPETPNLQPQEGNLSKQEILENLSRAFDEAETALEAGDREGAKERLPLIYDTIIALNKRSKEDWEIIWIWNPDGDLNEEEFNELNLRRKLLSNAVGIMTKSGEIRHDLNKI